MTYRSRRSHGATAYRRARCRSCSDHAGTTFSEYVLEQRLALARRLLADPRQRREKIASVAFAAGFGDLSYFYRAFRRRYDELPTDVRARADAPQ